MAPVRFSIVIATCDRPDPLVGTLEALAQAVHNVGGLSEIIVADNGAHRRAEPQVTAWTQRRKFSVRYLSCPPRDRCRALNVAVAHAQHPWLAFTDDDTLPDPGWLGAAAVYAAQGLCRCFGGRILPGPVPGPLPRWLQPDRTGRLPGHGIFVRYDPLPQDGLLEAGHPLPYGANVFVHRALFEQYGGFDETFYPALGSAALGGDDTEFLVRMRRAGEPIGYCRQALVVHPVHVERARLRVQCRLAYAYGRRDPWVFGTIHRHALEPYRIAQLLRWSGQLLGFALRGRGPDAVAALLKIARACGEMRSLLASRTAVRSPLPRPSSLWPSSL